jgi:hypothetical protein
MTPKRGVPVCLLLALQAGLLIGAGPAQGQGGTAYIVTFNNIWQEYDEVWAYIGTGLWFDWWCFNYEGGCVAMYYAYVQGTLERDSNGVDSSSDQMFSYPAGTWLSAEIPQGVHIFTAQSSHHVDYLWFDYYECWLGCELGDGAPDFSSILVYGEGPPPPEISGPDTTVWWFNGQTPSGYSTSITLTSSGGSSTTWEVSLGQSKISLSSSSGAQTTVTSTGAAFSGSVGDIGITATANGQTSAVFWITSRQPDHLHRGAVTDDCDGTYGYLTTIFYTIHDQLHAYLPSAVPGNEAWTTDIDPDYVGTNWRRRDPNGGMTDGSSLFSDTIGGETAGRIPTPTCNLGDPTKVQNWGQKWSVGSVTSGVGVPVQTNKLQKYIGHASHE